MAVYLPVVSSRGTLPLPDQTYNTRTNTDINIDRNLPMSGLICTFHVPSVIAYGNYLQANNSLHIVT